MGRRSWRSVVPCQNSRTTRTIIRIIIIIIPRETLNLLPSCIQSSELQTRTVGHRTLPLLPFQPVILPSSLIPTTQQGLRALIQSTGEGTEGCAMSSFVRPFLLLIQSPSPAAGSLEGDQALPPPDQPTRTYRAVLDEGKCRPSRRACSDDSLQSHPRGADLSSLRVRLQPMEGIRPGQPGCSVGGASAPERPVTPTPPPGNSLLSSLSIQAQSRKLERATKPVQPRRRRHWPSPSGLRGAFFLFLSFFFLPFPFQLIRITIDHSSNRSSVELS